MNSAELITYRHKYLKMRIPINQIPDIELPPAEYDATVRSLMEMRKPLDIGRTMNAEWESELEDCLRQGRIRACGINILRHGFEIPKHT
jgi:hypothetical protein